jgi:hypothetical protein
MSTEEYHRQLAMMAEEFSKMGKTYEEVAGEGMGIRRNPPPRIMQERRDRERGTVSPLGGQAVRKGTEPPMLHSGKPEAPWHSPR